jgi:PKD repeat protein
MDKSSPAKGAITSWYWDFGDTTTDNRQNSTHAYSNTSGYFTVLLRIEDEFGCKDSIEHEVLVLEDLKFPNIFTPTGSDGKKYVFKPMEEKGYFKEFQIVIYNRWGNFIWSNSCTDPNCPDYSDPFWWDGYNKQGKLVEDGVYYWVVTAKPLSETDIFIKNGSVTVINTPK